MPLLTAAYDGRCRVIAAADAAAQALSIISQGVPTLCEQDDASSTMSKQGFVVLAMKPCLGLRAGLPQAQAQVPGLAIAEADPAGDAKALERLAAWCLRYASLTAADLPRGVWLDVTGCAHLWDGEASLLADLLGCLRRSGLCAHAAVADTPGAAWAVARHAGQPATIIPPGGQADALAALPIAALRLEAEAIEGLRRLGLDRVGRLAAISRAPLARRFGAGVLLRLDQALGRVAEPTAPLFPPEMIQHRRAFPEPLLTAEALLPAIAHLTSAVCATLERAGHGARQLALLFERVDGHEQAVRIGTARPSRNARHLGRMLDERLDEVDPGLGIEAMRLVVLLAEKLAWTQAAALAGEAFQPVDLPALVDRLTNRLGADRIFRIAPVPSDVSERAVRPVPALAPPEVAGPEIAGPETSWPVTLPRPVRLFRPPQPVQALAALPDQPPAAFTWRRVRRRVRRSDGPERIHGEWWLRDGEARTVREYWAVEDEAGHRYWLFRRGNGSDRATGDLGWFLHGLF